MKNLKAFFLKIKWVLFGGKPFKKAMTEINEAKGIKIPKPVKKFKASNGSYSSTKRCSIK